MSKYLVAVVLSALSALSALLMQVLPQQAAPFEDTALLGDKRATNHSLSGHSLREQGLNGQAPIGHALVGVARVIDGDTIEIAGERVRLEGIDAPETHQTCRASNGKSWAAGRVSATHLERMLRWQSVTCHALGRDGYGRTLGHCSAGGRDINAAMIRTGMAWAFRKYSNAYLRDESVARQARAGIWAAQCQPAWEYRANRWQSAESDAPDGCAIKGNITRRGRIYHMPWSPWYGRTRIEVSRGERWFCNERQALDAGWRPAVVR